MSTAKGLSTDWGLCEPLKLSLHLATPYRRGEPYKHTTHFRLQSTGCIEEVVKIEIQDENPFRKFAQWSQFPSEGKETATLQAHHAIAPHESTLLV